MYDEIVELIAEAARSSPHARKAYELLREKRARDPGRSLPPLARMQEIIADRMSEVVQ